MTNRLSDIPDFTTVHDPKCPFDPQPVLYERREAGPVVPIRLWSGKQAWLVTGYNDQRTVLQDGKVSSDARHPNFPHQLPGMKASQESAPLILNMDNPKHDLFRRYLARDFMIRRIDALRPSIQQLVDELIDGLLAGPKPVDLVQNFSLMLPSTIIAEMLGVPQTDHHYFQGLANVIVASDSTEAESLAGTLEMLEYIGRLADAKLEAPGDDVISRLAQHWGNGEMTRDEVVGAGFILLVGGHETTANLINLSTVVLLQHPDQLAEIRESDDPAFIANAAEELLRYLHLTHSGLRRVATEDFELSGQLIHAGDAIVLAGNMGNRDPSAFDGDPEVLDIHRHARHHIAFGFGIHQCLGQPLARAEFQIVLATLFRRIPTLALDVDVDDIAFKAGNFNGILRLPVTW